MSSQSASVITLRLSGLAVTGNTAKQYNTTTGYKMEKEFIRESGLVSLLLQLTESAMFTLILLSLLPLWAATTWAVFQMTSVYKEVHYKVGEMDLFLHHVK